MQSLALDLKQKNAANPELARSMVDSQYEAGGKNLTSRSRASPRESLSSGDERLVKSHKKLLINLGIQGEEADGLTILKQSLCSQRDENSGLIKQLNKMNIEINNLKKINQEYEIQKRYLLNQIRRLRDYSNELQSQKVRHVSQISHYKSQISNYEGTMRVQDDKLFCFNSDIKKLIDELNFEKAMSGDYKKQNGYLKSQIKIFETSFLKFMEEFNKLTQQFDSEQKIHEKMSIFKNDLYFTKQDLTQCKLIYKQHSSNYQQILRTLKELENLNYQLKNDAAFRDKAQKQNLQEKNGVSDDRYIELVNQQQLKIASLIQQNMSLKTRNNQLQTQLSQLNKQQHSKIPRLHSNSTYILKIMQENNRQLKTRQQLQEFMEQEIDRLKQALELQSSTSRSKTEEIQKLTLLLKHQRHKKDLTSQEQISRIKQQNTRLQRKVDQLIDAQKTMKAQIIEKDKIIVTYVKNQKK